MRKYIILLALFLGVFGFLISPQNVFAYPVAVDQSIGFSNGPGTGGGGEFIVYDWDTKDDLFRTFCVERSEYISFGPRFTVGAISENVNTKTAYLYSHFAAGNLMHYVYGDTGNTIFGSRSESATALQNAIWFFQDQISGIDNEYIRLANDSGWTDIGNVRIIKLLTADGSGAQDQLTTVVPEPSTMLLFGVGLIGIASLTRKKFLYKS